MIRAAILALVAIVISFSGEDSIYWDCQYYSIEQCRTVVLAGSRGWCNPSPYATPTTQEKPSSKRRARPS